MTSKRISGLVFRVVYEKMSDYFCFKGICVSKVNHWEKCLILIVRVSFIREKCLSLFTLVNTGLSEKNCSEMLLKTGENIFQKHDLVG